MYVLPEGLPGNIYAYISQVEFRVRTFELLGPPRQMLMKATVNAGDDSSINGVVAMVCPFLLIARAYQAVQAPLMTEPTGECRLGKCDINSQDAQITACFPTDIASVGKLTADKVSVL